MRISDWSSDVCSSDLIPTPAPESDSSLFRSVFANASILLSGKAAGAVLGLGVAALAARALGIHAFGILILVHAFAEAVKDLAGFQSWQVVLRSEEHTAELQSLMRTSYSVFRLKKQNTNTDI